MTPTPCIAIGKTSLGWLAVISQDRTVQRVSIGQRSEAAAAAAVGIDHAGRSTSWERRLIERLTAFVHGEPDDFGDLQLELTGMTDFQLRVIECCRGIRWGQTNSYGQLAERSGYPRAARAVGSVMAANRFPLVVPCHRVIGANGSLRGFSAPQGTRLKERLLAREVCVLA